MSNAGPIVNPEGAMVVDALMVPSMTQRFLAGIKKVTKKPVRRLINTHHHVNHVGGNSFFRGAEIINHTYCREETERTGLPVQVCTGRPANS